MPRVCPSCEAAGADAKMRAVKGGFFIDCGLSIKLFRRKSARIFKNLLKIFIKAGFLFLLFSWELPLRQIFVY